MKQYEEMMRVMQDYTDFKVASALLCSMFALMFFAYFIYHKIVFASKGSGRFKGLSIISAALMVVCTLLYTGYVAYADETTDKSLIEVTDSKTDDEYQPIAPWPSVIPSLDNEDDDDYLEELPQDNKVPDFLGDNQPSDNTNAAEENVNKENATDNENVIVIKPENKPDKVESDDKDKDESKPGSEMETNISSVFEMADETASVLRNKYITRLDELRLIETNPSVIEHETVTVAVNGEVKVLEKGEDYSIEEVDAVSGKRYEYVLKKDLFDKEGFYQVNVMSEDENGLVNSFNENQQEINFIVDRTAPEIIVIGLESNVSYKEDSHIYHVFLTDNGLIKRFTILLDNSVYKTYVIKGKRWVNEENENDFIINEDGLFELRLDKSMEYHVLEFEAEDEGGNITKSEEYKVRAEGKSNSIAGIVSISTIVISLIAIYVSIVVIKRRKR